MNYDVAVVVSNFLEKRARGQEENDVIKRKEQQITNPVVINQRRSIWSMFRVRVAER